MQEPEAGRRIVSKGEYVSGVSKKAAMSSVGFGLLALNRVCIVVGVFAICGVCVLSITKGIAWPLIGGTIFILGCLASGANYTRRLGVRTLQEAKEIDTGIPLTRANTADLSAPDSLVRASQEPAQAQEGVLLRASSGESQSGQEGQLLRASVEGQE